MKFRKHLDILFAQNTTLRDSTLYNEMLFLCHMLKLDQKVRDRNFCIYGTEMSGTEICGTSGTEMSGHASNQENNPTKAVFG